MIKIAESEKAIHVGYFFNGKSETVFPGEERVVVPSPQTGDYASVPAMSAAGVVDAVEKALAGRRLQAHHRQPGQRGRRRPHRGQEGRPRGRRDRGPGPRPDRRGRPKREKAVLVVTADHGTVEEWLYPDGTVNTGHTKNPVPFILADLSGEAGPAGLAEGGRGTGRRRPHDPRARGDRRPAGDDRPEPHRTSAARRACGGRSCSSSSTAGAGATTRSAT